MSFKATTEKELRVVAENLFSPIIAELRAEVAELRLEAKVHAKERSDSVARHNAAVKAANKEVARAKVMLQRVLGRLTALENKR